MVLISLLGFTQDHGGTEDHDVANEDTTVLNIQDESNVIRCDVDIVYDDEVRQYYAFECITTNLITPRNKSIQPIVDLKLHSIKNKGSSAFEHQLAPSDSLTMN